jgi:hypothetical protein
MGRRRLLRSGLWAFATAVAVAVVSLTVGNAASVSTGSKSLGAQGVAVPRCDTDAYTIVQNLTSSNVVSVTVTGIASACATATMSATVNNGTSNSSGSATVPGGGGSLTITLAVPVAATDVEQIDVSVVGP